ncbi:MAG: LysE family translocator [Thermodesulfobacteriota bacterium]|nr:LysE family translocator [Thermodesulfobacteriota bacterium]
MQDGTWSFFLAGAILGLSAGISPGPLLALVVSETLSRGMGAGMRVSLAPLITDLPIVLISVLLLARLAEYKPLLGVISLTGACFLLFLAYESLSARNVSLDTAKTPAKSLQKGVLVNFLNPHPYLFWLTVGAPLLVKGFAATPLAPGLFLAGFYVCIVGSKISVAAVVEKSRAFFSGKTYPLTLKVMGVALALFAVLFFKDGLTLLGIL